MVLSEEKLRECFDLPLHVASKKMGICITAIKKVCRKLGIHKWPYRELKERKAAIKGRGGDADVAGSVGADTGLVEHQRVSGRRSESFAEPTRLCSTRNEVAKRNPPRLVVAKTQERGVPASQSQFSFGSPFGHSLSHLKSSVSENFVFFRKRLPRC